MRAYDAGSIPGGILRRPRVRPRGDDAKIVKLIIEGGERSILKLVRIITTRPTAGNIIAETIRHHLSRCIEVRKTLHVLDQLMRLCPYFYRYTAHRRFFDSFWSVYKCAHVEIDVRDRILILLRAWAEDLSASFRRRSDPPALFWIDRYQRKRSSVAVFPEIPITDDGVPFVCPIGQMNISLHSRRAGTKNRTKVSGRVLNTSELEASLALLDRLLSTAENTGRWNAIAPDARYLYNTVRRSIPREFIQEFAYAPNDDEDDDELPTSSSSSGAYTTGTVGGGSDGSFFSTDDEGATLRLPLRAGPADPKAAAAAVQNSKFTALNEKVVAVLRRYDESFARFDPYLAKVKNANGGILTDDELSRSTISVNKRTSVAAVAREEARWKLSMSGSTWTVDNDLVDGELSQPNTGLSDYPACTPAMPSFAGFVS